MSEDEVKMVRDKIMCLYLDPSDFVTAAPVTRKMKGVDFTPCSHVVIHGGMFPCFSWNKDHKKYDAWLKVVKGKRISFDLRIDGAELIQVPFKDERVRIAAELIKALSRYFPFIPTSNYLQHGGGFIA